MNIITVLEDQTAEQFLDHLDDKYVALAEALTTSSHCNLALNEMTGQAMKINKEGLYEAVKIIQSELDELKYKGIDCDNPVEILDGAVDVWVTVFGILAKLETAGYDVAGAVKQTDMNNLTKFTTDIEVVKQSVEYYAEQGITITPTFHKPAGRYILLDENNKYRKPVGFVSNDLSAFVPK